MSNKIPAFRSSRANGCPTECPDPVVDVDPTTEAISGWVRPDNGQFMSIGITGVDTVTVPGGRGFIIGPNGDRSEVVWEAAELTLTGVVEHWITTIAINAAGDIVQYHGNINPLLARSHIILGTVTHINNAAGSVQMAPSIWNGIAYAAYDMAMLNRNLVFDGGVVRGNPVNKMSLDIDGRQLFNYGGAMNSLHSPNTIYQPKQHRIKFYPAIGTSSATTQTTDVNPLVYNNGGGSSTTQVPSAGQATIQRLYQLGDEYILLFGQHVYDSLDESVDHAFTEQFTIPSKLSLGSLLATICVRAGATDLNNLNDARILLFPTGSGGRSEGSSPAPIDPPLDPPILHDNFTVTETPAGLRRYDFSFSSANEAKAIRDAVVGVEIRYKTGYIDPDPVNSWATLTPLSSFNTYYTASFESTRPETAGWYTFVLRTRNRQGTLSTEGKVVKVELFHNFSNVIGSLQSSIVNLNNRANTAYETDLDLYNRIAGVLLDVSQLGEDLRDEIAASATQFGNEIMLMHDTVLQEMFDTPEWSPTVTYTNNFIVKRTSQGKMYRSNQPGNLGRVPESNPQWWEPIGSYSSLGGALTGQATAISTLSSRTTQTENAIVAEASARQALAVQIAGPNGNGTVSGLIFNEANIRASADATNSNNISLQASQIQSMSGQISNANALIATNHNIFLTQHGAEVSRRELLQAALVGDATVNDLNNPNYTLSSGRIYEELDLIVKPNGVIAQRSSQVLAQWAGPGVPMTAGGFQAAVTNQVTAATGPTSAIGQSITDIRADMREFSSSITELSSAIVNVDGQAVARYALSLDVLGRVSGMVMDNDGISSEIAFLADKFRLISTGSSGMEIISGTRNVSGINRPYHYLRVYGPTFQRVIGHGFGLDYSDGLVDWFGPNLPGGAMACSKTNGLQWSAVDLSGTPSAYFGGTLSAGILKNAKQSSTVGITAVETGSFGTNGRPKVVVVSLTYQNTGLLSSNPGPGNSIGTVKLERSYNGGVWTEINSDTITGTRSTEYDDESGKYQVNVNASVVFTTTDTFGGNDNFNYRAEIVGPTGAWPLTIGSSQGFQRLSIVCTEE